MNTINATKTKYGDLVGITSSASYKDGSLKSCMLDQENVIQTPAGPAIPQYSEPVFGERQKKHRSSIDFHKNGEIKSLALDKQMPLETPAGTIDAELVTFYDNGSVNRIFPLNGLIDGYWSENHEREMTKPIKLDLPTGTIDAKLISLHFYEEGSIKSATAWPGEKLRIETPLGMMEGRAGLSLHENGALRSFEPAAVTKLPSPIGEIKAFDPDIIGMHADQNSVQFNETGSLTAVTTMHTGVKVTDSEGQETIVQPYEAASFIDATQLRTVPIKISFTADMLIIQAKELHSFPLDGHKIETFERKRVFRDCCSGCPGEDDPSCCQNGGSCGGCGGA